MQQVLETYLNPIASATDYDHSIVIIPKDECDEAILCMQNDLLNRFPDPQNQISLVPIKMGGLVIGQSLARPSGVEPNPMRISNYDENDNSRLDHPICLEEPDLGKIVVGTSVRTVVFAEAVVESQRTVELAQQVITTQVEEYGQRNGQRLPAPNFHTYALVSKIEEGEETVPNLHAAFIVHHDIWVHGLGCDNQGRGREIRRIEGVLSPSAQEPPERPYYRRLF